LRGKYLRELLRKGKEVIKNVRTGSFRNLKRFHYSGDTLTGRGSNNSPARIIVGVLEGLGSGGGGNVRG